MIDYAAIADRAVELIGSADEAQHMAAYQQMKDETVTTQVSGPVFETEIDLMSRLGVQDADTILSKIEAAVTARVQRLIQSERGINLNDPQTQGLIAALVQGGALTQGESDMLMAGLTSTALRFHGLRSGHVQNALQKRAAGEV